MKQPHSHKARAVTIGVKFFMGLLMMCGWAWSASAQEYPIAGFEKLIVVVPSAQVNIVAGTGNTVRVQGGEWSAREDGSSLRLVGGLGVASSGRTQMARVEIQVPPLPIEIHVQDGQVQIQKWTKAFLVDLQKGKIIAKENRSRGQLSINQGVIQINDHQGSLSVDSYRGDVTADKIVGNFEASIFNGELKVDDLNGQLKTEIYQGGLKLGKSTGSLVFDMGKATTTVGGFRGRIEGKSREGVVQLEAHPETDVVVKTEQARIIVNSKNSGSLLLAKSEEGDIQAPRTMRVGRDKNARVLRGRLKGKNSGSRIDISSDKAMLIVRD